MKFNRLLGYATQPELGGRLLYSRALILAGRRQEARRVLEDVFERAAPADMKTSAGRKRKRMLGDASEWLADIYLSQGEATAGIAFFERLVARHPGWSALYPGLCRLMFPGDGHVETLAALHRRIVPGLYVEIGVSKGVSLAVAAPETDAVGVDPAPQIECRLTKKSSIYSETSDAFFEAYGTRPQFSDRRIDMAFIDGLHLFEQALRDFINVEKHAKPGGLIAIHDCIPFDDINAGRDDNVEYWVGDVWKLLAVLLDRRPDLDITVVGAAPSGLVLVRRLDPSSRLLEDGFAAIVDAYMPLRISHWHNNYARRIRIVPSNAAEVARMFATTA